jgi:hypothetical protein
MDLGPDFGNFLRRIDKHFRGGLASSTAIVYRIAW